MNSRPKTPTVQNQLAALFDSQKLKCEAQAVTEAQNKPDFIFPGSAEYHDPRFDTSLLIMLGAKSTLKERWRQILTEAEKIPRKHLCTLELAISKKQTDEIAKHAVQLVIPEPFQATYTAEQKQQLWTVSAFVEFVRGRQRWLAGGPFKPFFVLSGDFHAPQWCIMVLYGDSKTSSCKISAHEARPAKCNLARQDRETG